MGQRRCVFVTSLAFVLVSGSSAIAAAADAVDFDKVVAPIVAGRCLGCHSGGDAKGGLDLSREKKVLAGGDSGAALTPGKLGDSLLWQRISKDEMPPKHPLSDSEKNLLKAWIISGAKWGTDPIDPYRFTSATRAGADWWSLQPLQRANPPRVNRAVSEGFVRNPIDAFVAARLSARKLTPNPPANRETLIRRWYSDLIGLPPTPAEVRQFVEDKTSGAEERLVRKLLDSSHYGERWARHWLDVAHFGESDGFEYDRMRPHAWRYRDWVIQSLNRDLPYNEFARLQIAGDVLHPRDSKALIATGFLVAGAFDSLVPAGDEMRQIMRQDELEDIVGIVGQTFLGLTINCARCHDHKFDPIRQRDYYRIASALAGVKRGEHKLPPEPVPELLARHIQRLERQVAEFEEPLRTAMLRIRLAAAREQARQFTEAAAFAVTPQKAPVTHVLRRGNHREIAEVVSAGGLEVLLGSGSDFGLAPDASDADRRIRLANWVASDKNPLFARTIVNRIWYYHFGRGLIDTPNDLGFSGGQPSHPELLDWLASELIRSGWSLKELHRIIVLSGTYRQSSASRTDAIAVDADNRSLWRYAPRRLDAEGLRDSVLNVSGTFNSAAGGPSFQDFRPFFHRGSQFYEMLDPVGEEYNRRSIYRMWVRGGRNPLLDAFDCPDPSTTAPKRGVTTTPLQSLSLMNNSFMLRMSDHFADRLKREAGDKVEAQLRLGFELAWGRPPRTPELETGIEFVRHHGLAPFCRALLNSNGFLYVR